MKYFCWQPGRSEATKNIRKFPVWSWLGFDIYLLKFPKGQLVGTHTDPVEGKKHRRFNLTLWGFWILTRDKEDANQSLGDAHLFRPDIVPHSARFLTDCMVLSIGWTTKQKHEKPPIINPDSGTGGNHLCSRASIDQVNLRSEEATPAADQPDQRKS